MKPYILGAVFARGGSKGILGKNIKMLAGKPLLAYAIEVGLSIPLVDKMMVSTDDAEIARIAKQFGAEVPFMRPKELAQDDSPEILAWQHAIDEVERQEGRKVDVLLSIPTTSPLRKVSDVENCLNKLLRADADAVITVTEAQRNPYFNMVTLDEKDRAQLVVSSKASIECRQKAPKVYNVTTVAYAVRRDFIRSGRPLFEGTIEAVVIPPERALDIDEPLDFEIAEFLMSRKK